RHQRHQQADRYQDFGLSRRPQRPGPRGYQAMTPGVSDDDITTAEPINFEEMNAPATSDEQETYAERSAAELEAVFDVPVRISVVLGRTKMPVSQLLRMDTGTIIELDRQVGEA